MEEITLNNYALLIKVWSSHVWFLSKNARQLNKHFPIFGIGSVILVYWSNLVFDRPLIKTGAKSLHIHSCMQLMVTVLSLNRNWLLLGRPLAGWILNNEIWLVLRKQNWLLLGKLLVVTEHWKTVKSMWPIRPSLKKLISRVWAPSTDTVIFKCLKPIQEGPLQSCQILSKKVQNVEMYKEHTFTYIN
jgi:hypothetical protein